MTFLPLNRFSVCFRGAGPAAAGPAPIAGSVALVPPGPPRRARNRSPGQVRPGLLGHQVGGVPGGPVLVLGRAVEKVRPPGALLVLDVGGLGPPKRAGW